MSDKKISHATMARYPVYLKALRLMNEEGREHFLSSELSDQTHIQDTTIRRDFSFLPQPIKGRRGIGYDTKNMIDALSKQLGLGLKEEPIILVGVGTLGTAMIKYNSWQNTVGKIVCAYDQNAEVVGHRYDINVYHINELEYTFPPECKIAILAISDDVQDTVDRLVRLGVRGIVDFTHSHFMVPRYVNVQSVDVVVAIQELIMKMNEKNNEEDSSNV